MYKFSVATPITADFVYQHDLANGEELFISDFHHKKENESYVLTDDIKIAQKYRIFEKSFKHFAELIANTTEELFQNKLHSQTGVCKCSHIYLAPILVIRIYFKNNGKKWHSAFDVYVLQNIFQNQLKRLGIQATRFFQTMDPMNINFTWRCMLLFKRTKSLNIVWHGSHIFQTVS